MSGSLRLKLDRHRLNGLGEDIGSLPEAGAGKKAVLEAGAGRCFEVEVGEVEFDRGARVLVGEIDAGDALVVGGEGEGDAAAR